MQVEKNRRANTMWYKEKVNNKKGTIAQLLINNNNSKNNNKYIIHIQIHTRQNE